MPPATERFQMPSATLAALSVTRALPSRRGVTKQIAASPAFESQPYTTAFTNACWTRGGSKVKVRPKRSGNSKANDGIARRAIARKPRPVPAASQTAAATKYPIAALPGPSGIQARRRLGRWSYGRSFLGLTGRRLTVMRREDPPAMDRWSASAAALYRTHARLRPASGYHGTTDANRGWCDEASRIAPRNADRRSGMRGSAPRH